MLYLLWEQSDLVSATNIVFVIGTSDVVSATNTVFVMGANYFSYCK